MRAGKDNSKRVIKPSKRLSTVSIPVEVSNSTSIKEYSFHSGVMYSLHDSIPAQVLSQRNKILSIFRGNPMLPGTEQLSELFCQVAGTARHSLRRASRKSSHCLRRLRTKISCTTNGSCANKSTTSCSFSASTITSDPVASEKGPPSTTVPFSKS